MLCLSVGGAEVGMVGCIGAQWARVKDSCAVGKVGQEARVVV